jgi:probable HAF family extracellular repeat protein
MKIILEKILITGICVLFIVSGFVTSSGSSISEKISSNFENNMEPIAQTPTYWVVDLGTLGGSEANALGISQNGLITGGADAIEDWWPYDLRHAFLWKNGHMKNLGTLGEGAYSEGWGVNDRGQVVGISELERFTAEFYAFFYDGETMIALKTLGGVYNGAYAINNRGEIVGFADTSIPSCHAVLWYQDKIRDLGTLGGVSSSASDINELGQIVGKAYLAIPEEHAFLWLPEPAYGLPAGMNDLGVLPGGIFSEARAVNDLGHVVGKSQTSDGLLPHAFLWKDGRMIDLSPGNSTHSRHHVNFATDINNHDQVVGCDHHQELLYRAVLWQQNRMIDLNQCIPNNSGWYLLEANGINDAGQIVGFGIHQGYWGFRAFLLTPMG